MTRQSCVDADALREKVRELYGEVATRPDGNFRFHTGRALARRLGYGRDVVESIPDAAVESFTGVGNPFSLRPLTAGEHVVDLGSGAGFDCVTAARQVGSQGRVVGVDMTEEMLDKSREIAQRMKLDNVEFRAGLMEDVPVDDGWADVVISNGAINLCADKARVFAEVWRLLRPGGHLQFADIAHGRPVPTEAIGDIDLWTAWIVGGLPCEGWRKKLADAGFADIRVGSAVDTFAGTSSEDSARRFQVFGYAFIARKPTP